MIFLFPRVYRIDRLTLKSSFYTERYNKYDLFYRSSLFTNKRLSEMISNKIEDIQIVIQSWIDV